MKITYLGHSGFAVEFEDRMLVFDYYEGELPQAGEKRKCYVFSSHSHKDHFQEKIFEWEDQGYEVTYILSDDIRPREKGKNILPVGPRRTYDVDDMQVKTLRSTDKGVAFFVYVKGKRIYHGGDLNWWHWEEESAAYNEMMKRKYQYEISRIGDIPIDVAFVPLDPRQEEQYDWGMDYFMKHTDTRCVFPMHMWGDYSVCGRLKASEGASAYADRFQSIEAPGQVFEIQ